MGKKMRTASRITGKTIYMYTNPFIKIVSVLIGVAVFVGLALLVLPMIGAVVVGVVVLIALLSFSGWIARLFRGGRDSAPDAPQEAARSYEYSQKEQHLLGGSWRKEDAEDAEVIEKDKK
jgi:ABC-type amino acid transport system permease subunit